MKHNYKLLALLCLLPGGCIKDTTLDAGVERRVVVEFVLTEDSVQNLFLSFTRGPGESEAPSVQEADIKLIDLTQKSEMTRFVKMSENQWSLDYAGLPGHRYRVEVKVKGSGTVWAEQQMPEKTELIRAGFSHSVSLPWYAGYGTFYFIDNVPDYLFIQGIKRDKETGEFIPVEELCTDYPGVEEINATGKFYDGNPKWRTGTEKPFVYHDNPVDGMDGVWTYLFHNLIGKELHNGFLLISRVDDNHAGLDRLYDFSTAEGLYSGKGFCISGSFYNSTLKYDDAGNLDYDQYLVVSSLSKDYGQFLKDAYQLRKIHESDDLSTIYLRDNIYSNIQGGLGIFGAKASGLTVFLGQYQPTEPH